MAVGDVADLLAEMLGGPVDSPSADRLWRLSAGNALMLRELVIAAHASGEMTQSYGIWRWTGRLELAPSLTDLIDARIGQLTRASARSSSWSRSASRSASTLLHPATDADDRRDAPRSAG